MLLINLLFPILVAMNSQQPPEEKPLFTFGIFADAQYGDAERTGTRFYSASAGKLKDAYGVFRKENVDFVINLGDIIDRDFSSYYTVLKIINDSGIKTYSVTGNHDYAVENYRKEKLPVSGKKNYYSLQRNGFRLIFLDGNEISTYSSANEKTVAEAKELLSGMKSAGMKNAMDWNGAISSIQLKWLEKQLASAESKGEKALILCHFPVFPEDVHNLLNYNEVLSILGKHKNAIVWLAGHNHAGNYGNYNNMHCLTFRGMVETPSSSSFAVIDVFSDRLEVRGYGREENRILAF